MKKKQQVGETVLILTICVVLMCIVYFLTFALMRKDITDAKMASERVLFDMYVSSKANVFDIDNLLDNHGVVGLVIYDKNGKAYFKYGDVPDFESFSKMRYIDDYSSIKLNGKYVEYVAHPRGQTATSLAKRSVRVNPFGLPSELPESEDNIDDYDTPVPIVYLKRLDAGFVHKMVALRVIQLSSIIIIAALGFTLLRYRKKTFELSQKLNKKDATATVGEAARTLAHEIKNPLSTIMIQLAILKKMHPESEDDYSAIENEVNRILTLCDRTTGFLSNPVGNPQNIPLVPFCREFTTRFDYPLILAFEPESENAEVLFDEVRLRSVIENLIKNAIESMETANPNDDKNKEPVKLEISLQGKTAVRLLVEDRGVGLPKDINRENLFNPFFTTKPTGSGIGLSICRQFVEAQGGEILLYPRDNGGTIAEVIFKRANV